MLTVGDVHLAYARAMHQIQRFEGATVVDEVMDLLHIRFREPVEQMRDSNNPCLSVSCKCVSTPQPFSINNQPSAINQFPLNPQLPVRRSSQSVEGINHQPVDEHHRRPIPAQRADKKLA